MKTRKRKKKTVHTVEQTFCYYSKIEADSEEDAIEIAQEMHVPGADVVENCVDIQIVEINGEAVDH